MIRPSSFSATSSARRIPIHGRHTPQAKAFVG